jgi:nitrate reductase molybdenum cofactor assembly chaperone NarJ/NarW
VLGALIELAGEKAQPVEPAAEPPLDESWAEPVAFDGCSIQGQARPGREQPIHLVRQDTRNDARKSVQPGAVA